MGIRLRRSEPAYLRIDLGHGASVDVRPITSLELDEIVAEVDLLISDLKRGSEAVKRMSAMLCHDIREDMLTSETYAMALSERMTRFRVAMRCIGNFEGVFDPDGTAIDPRNESHVALFMLDPGYSRIVGDAAYRNVHDLELEKKELPYSQNGAAEGAQNIAATAERTATAAPEVSPATTANSARN